MTPHKEIPVRVTAGPVVPGKTSVTVPAGTAGSATSIDIALNDEFGNPVGGASGQIAVAVSGANTSSPVPVEEQSGGRYRAQYTPTVAGTDQVEVRDAREVHA